MNGTPKTLIEAIRNGMYQGPLNQIDTQIVKHVRDFLAQKFAASYLLCRRGEEARNIKDLWIAITGEDNETKDD